MRAGLIPEHLRALGRPGFRLLGLAALSLGLHVWFLRSVFLPVEHESGIEYVFVSANFGTFGAATVAALLLALGVHGLVRWMAERSSAQTTLFARDDVAYLRPVCCFAVSALCVGSLVPGLSGVMPVWLFLIVDLRWWWTAAVTTWVLVGIDRRLHGAPRRLISRIRFPPHVRAWAPALMLAGIATTWVVAGTPNLRFSSVVHGDEPKYLLHCESLYQGVGFDISRVRAIAELPPDFAPRTGRNFRLMAAVLPGELRSLAADAVAFLAEPSRRFNRAQRTAGFLTGKNGGTYMVHQPGMSFLMYPAYYIDRRLTVAQPSPIQWPDRLRAVNAFFLTVYVVWTVVVFRFLRRLVQSTSVAWITTLALMLTLPVAAFPFQFYPELVAGVLIFVVAGHVLFPSAPRRPRPVRCPRAVPSFLYGLLAGYLPWLHVRFSVVGLVLAVGAGLALRRDRQRALGFAAGFAVALACLALYAYRITGSVTPTALWYAEGGGQVLSLTGAIRGSLAYLVDRDWGLLAHAPVYLLALPGYYWLARSRPAVAWLCGAGLFALLLPAAGHTLDAAATTPMRLIVAVVPLAAVPLAEVLARYGSWRPFQIVFGFLLVLSLHSALVYNLHHLKHVGPLVDRSLSGWNASMLFPSESMFPWEVSAGNGWLAVVWIGTLLTLLALPCLIQAVRRRKWLASGQRLVMNSPGPGIVVLAVVAAFGLLGTMVSATTGDWWNGRFRVPAAVPAWEAAGLLDEIDHCAVCVSSLDGRIGTAAVLTRLAAIAPAIAARDEVPEPPGPQAYAGWLAMPGLIRAWYVEAKGRGPSRPEVVRHLSEWREEALSPEEIRRRILTSTGTPPAVEPGRELGETAWLAMPELIRTWYVEAHGRDPSDTDFVHYLYEWREDEVPPEEIRLRIFAAAEPTADAERGSRRDGSPDTP